MEPASENKSKISRGDLQRWQLRAAWLGPPELWHTKSRKQPLCMQQKREGVDWPTSWQAGWLQPAAVGI